MKKCLSLALVCLVLALSIVIPSAALSERAAAMRDDAYAHLKECVGEGKVCTHQHVYPVAVEQPVHAHAATDKEYYNGKNYETEIQKEYRARLACTHSQCRYFVDEAEDAAYRLCLGCGIDEELTIDAVQGEVVIPTSTARRSICQHEYGSWSVFDQNAHYRFCTKCDLTDVGVHDCVPATCETDAHCAVCGYTDGSWERRFGHTMRFVCPQPGISPIDEYRCVRMNGDFALVCDYRKQVDTCSFVLIIEPASNGIHDRWQMCMDCGNPQDLPDAECSAPYYCWLCEHVG